MRKSLFKIDGVDVIKRTVESDWPLLVETGTMVWNIDAGSGIPDKIVIGAAAVKV